MKVLLAICLIGIGLLAGCGGDSPTAPRTAPPLIGGVTPGPKPTKTPVRGPCDGSPINCPQ
jgi:hypothetical protein